MSKTAIQELIDIVEMDYKNGVEISMKVFHIMLTDAKEKEKQQIIDSNNAGYQAHRRDIDQSAHDYYNETFKQ